MKQETCLMFTKGVQSIVDPPKKVNNNHWGYSTGWYMPDIVFLLQSCFQQGTTFTWGWTWQRTVDILIERVLLQYNIYRIFLLLLCYTIFLFIYCSGAGLRAVNPPNSLCRKYGKLVPPIFLVGLTLAVIVWGTINTLTTARWFPVFHTINIGS